MIYVNNFLKRNWSYYWQIGRWTEWVKSLFIAYKRRKKKKDCIVKNEGMKALEPDCLSQSLVSLLLTLWPGPVLSFSILQFPKTIKWSEQ